MAPDCKAKSLVNFGMDACANFAHLRKQCAQNHGKQRRKKRKKNLTEGRRCQAPVSSTTNVTSRWPCTVHRSRGGSPFAQRDPGKIVSHAEERSKIKCDFPTPDRQPLRFTGGTHPRANMHIEFELDFIALGWSRGARRMSLGRRVKPPQDLSVVFNISGGCL